MEVIFAPKAVVDLEYWKSAGNKKIQKKITDLLNSILAHPFAGIGKPEALKFDYAGCWSRRINKEHRFIYEVVGDTIQVLSLKDHY
jgi:toxin YoeB